MQGWQCRIRETPGFVAPAVSDTWSYARGMQGGRRTLQLLCSTSRRFVYVSNHYSDAYGIATCWGGRPVPSRLFSSRCDTSRQGFCCHVAIVMRRTEPILAQKGCTSHKNLPQSQVRSDRKTLLLAWSQYPTRKQSHHVPRPTIARPCFAHQTAEMRHNGILFAKQR